MHAGGFHHHSAHVAVAQRLAFGNIRYEPNAYFCLFCDGDAHCGLRGLQRLAGMALTSRRTASQSDQGQRRLPAGTVGGSAHFDCQTAAPVSGSGCCGTLYAAGGFHQTVANGSFLTLSGIGADRCCCGRLAGIDIDPTHLVQKPLPPLAYLFLLFVAGRAPGWFLSELAERRQNRIRLFIPKAVDLLTICMSCGMSLEEAFDRVASEIARRAPEVAKEFRMTRYEMLVVNRTVALKRLEARSGVREMKILANSLLQSIQYGTPLTEALQSIAAEARAGQLSELEQKAGRISAVIGVPLIVLVLFPVIALIIAPAAIELARAF